MNFFFFLNLSASAAISCMPGVLGTTADLESATNFLCTMLYIAAVSQTALVIKGTLSCENPPISLCPNSVHQDTCLYALSGHGDLKKKKKTVMKTARCFQVMGSTTEEQSGKSVTVCTVSMEIGTKLVIGLPTSKLLKSAYSLLHRRVYMVWIVW